MLMARIIAATPAREDADHIPLIVDQNPQVPSRIAALIEGTGADPGPVLAAMARGLQAAGAEALAMPCNTAHHYAPAIRAAVTIPLIDMVALAAAEAARRVGPGGRVGILASPAVRSTGLFDAALAAHGSLAVYPVDQSAMLAAIRAIKAEGPVPAARAALAAAARDLAGQGAGVQLVACTEFSLIADAARAEAPALDTLDLLAAEIVRLARAGAPRSARAATDDDQPEQRAAATPPNSSTERVTTC